MEMPFVAFLDRTAFYANLQILQDLLALKAVSMSNFEVQK
jgi:hypothetical protein